ncbi:hypothetical protein H4219_005208 [Mycoemilia scoparia]|uniref:GST N-terminal domain-containing protein n=1 Tax=Mycoemilia scoparia TaxID=417184 RepID=A0A9W7ZPZ4_9FUNG|nr:hypothetical protein H4219_005208 [Mycoemilia scoparia]
MDNSSGQESSSSPQPQHGHGSGERPGNHHNRNDDAIIYVFADLDMSRFGNSTLSHFNTSPHQTSSVAQRLSLMMGPMATVVEVGNMPSSSNARNSPRNQRSPLMDRNSRVYRHLHGVPSFRSNYTPHCLSGTSHVQSRSIPSNGIIRTSLPLGGPPRLTRNEYSVLVAQLRDQQRQQSQGINLLSPRHPNSTEHDDEAPLKPNTSSMRLPVLIDRKKGLAVSESKVIERYLACKFVLPSSDPKVAAKQEQIRAQYAVMLAHLVALPVCNHEEILEKNGNSSHDFDDELTHPDIAAYVILNIFKEYEYVSKIIEERATRLNKFLKIVGEQVKAIKAKR